MIPIDESIVTEANDRRSHRLHNAPIAGVEDRKSEKSKV